MSDKEGHWGGGGGGQIHCMIIPVVTIFESLGFAGRCDH